MLFRNSLGSNSCWNAILFKESFFHNLILWLRIYCILFNGIYWQWFLILFMRVQYTWIRQEQILLSTDLTSHYMLYFFFSAFLSFLLKAPRTTVIFQGRSGPIYQWRNSWGTGLCHRWDLREEFDCIMAHHPGIILGLQTGCLPFPSYSLPCQGQWIHFCLTL